MKPPPTATWRAAKDGIGHALVKGQFQTRYLCGGSPIPERFAWTVKTKCEQCVAELDRLTQPAPAPAPQLTESESRLMDGNR